MVRVAWPEGRVPVEVLFFARVGEPTDGGCMEWQGCRQPPPGHAYGRFLHEGRSRYAHRIAWQLMYGPIPNGMDVLHRCDNPPCVNPEHLWLGTHADNMRDAANKGRVPGRSMPGESHPNAKLTWAAVDDVRASNLSSKALAAKYGVTVGCIQEVRNGTTWVTR